MTSTFHTVLPSASRLMVSLRDIGYDLPSAVADLVDNSIDANARNISIDIVADGPRSWLRVTDDGLGMTRSDLDEAMRYGTDTDYGNKSLGHFGLGLKTASLSQCRRLTVASRKADGVQTAIRRWDLDDVIAKDSWELERVSAGDAPDSVTQHLDQTEHGTVVLWESLDRMIPAKPTAGMTERVLKHSASEVRGHLAMVFHRFLDGEAYDGRHRLSLVVNGEAVDAWDPFARSEEHTRALQAQTVEVEQEDGGHLSIGVQPFVLPGQQLFSSPEAHREAAGPRRWNRHQGFYIYRRDRMIQAGGWNRIRTLDEHAKLARIAIDLPLGQEDRFAVDVAKMRVSIPDDLRPGLRTLASAVVASAQERYRDHLHEIEAADERPQPSTEAISISRDWPVILGAVDRVLANDPELRDRLLLELANGDADAASVSLGSQPVSEAPSRP